MDSLLLVLSPGKSNSKS